MAPKSRIFCPVKLLSILISLVEIPEIIGLQIASAHISTYGERVVDVFYVKDVFGLRVEHEGKIIQIKRALLNAIDPPKNSRDDKLGKKSK